ncbi:unnamed protein product [Lathyrus oleraceus]
MFVYKSATYLDVVYLRYFIDLRAIHEYNLGVACLIYLYSKLGEGCLGKTKKMIGSCMLLTVWIISNFPRINEWEYVPTYTEDWPHASYFVMYRGNNDIEAFKMYLDYNVSDDIALCLYRSHH